LSLRETDVAAGIPLSSGARIVSSGSLGRSVEHKEEVVKLLTTQLAIVGSDRARCTPEDLSQRRRRNVPSEEIERLATPALGGE
jgi:hypothetical protein